MILDAVDQIPDLRVVARQARETDRPRGGDSWDDGSVELAADVLSFPRRVGRHRYGEPLFVSTPQTASPRWTPPRDRIAARNLDRRRRVPGDCHRRGRLGPVPLSRHADPRAERRRFPDASLAHGARGRSHAPARSGLTADSSSSASARSDSTDGGSTSHDVDSGNSDRDSSRGSGDHDSSRHRPSRRDRKGRWPR